MDRKSGSDKPVNLKCLWSALSKPLSCSVSKTVENLKFDSMTPVQAAVIPLFTSNKDVAVEAETGSGKTLAFIIPIIEILLKRETPLKKYDIGALIIAPTRELAIQINEVLLCFLSNELAFTQMLLIGGNNPANDIENLRTNGANILIATPGRIEDLFKRKDIDLSAWVRGLEVLVLDEADRLLDMGFEKSINEILRYLPKQRRTGLFSATQTDELEDLIRAGLRNPVRITVKEKSKKSDSKIRTPASLKNYYMIVESNDKFNHLIDFLHQHKEQKIMVFFSTCASVEYFSKLLKLMIKNSNILALHGKQASRSAIFKEFHTYKEGILLCTDVMGRGVDFPDIDWVLQYDPPNNASAFVHRCGRTARIGNEGNALVFLLPSEDSYIRFIEINQKVPLCKYEDLKKTADCLNKVRKIAMTDRAIYEKGLRAFVAFTQSYAKHECNLIFRIKDLDFGKLGNGFGLLHLPKMPELKGKDVDHFTPVEMDFKQIPYKDKNREKIRQESLKKIEENGPVVKHFKKKSVPWSKNIEKKNRKRRRKEIKELKKQTKQAATENENEDEDVADLDDLNEDFNLIKRLKKGKISKEDFDKEFDNCDDDIEENS